MAPVTTVSLVVKFWFEDDVWNAVTEDLPVAVYGHSIDEARAALEEAVVAHLTVAGEMGMLGEVITHLQSRQARTHTVEDIEPGEMWSKLIAPLPAGADCHA